MIAGALVLCGLVTLFLVTGFVRSLVARYRQNPRAARYHGLNLMLWIAAIVSLSQCFATYRRFSGEQPNPYPILNDAGGVFFLGILVCSFLVLGFFMYREDSRNGHVKRKLPLYERFMTRSES